MVGEVILSVAVGSHYHTRLLQVNNINTSLVESIRLKFIHFLQTYFINLSRALKLQNLNFASSLF